MFVALVLFDVAAGIELVVDRRVDEWTPLYWAQPAAAVACAAYGLFALWANRETVEEMFFFLPHVVAFMVLLLPVSVVLAAYGATFALGYWSYRS